MPQLFQQPDYGTHHQPIQSFPSRGNQWGEDEVGLFYPQQTPDTKYNLHYIHNGWNKNTGFNLYILLCVYLSLMKVKSDWGFWMGMDDIWGIVLVSITAAGLGCFTNIFGWQFYYMEQHWKTSWICIYGPAFLLVQQPHLWVPYCYVFDILFFFQCRAEKEICIYIAPLTCPQLFNSE